jgi:hypothetical protein
MQDNVVRICMGREEFGNTVSCGLLIPHILKNEGKFYVDVRSRLDLPESITSQVADKFTLVDPRKCPCGECNRAKSDIMKLLMNGSKIRPHSRCFKSIEVPEGERLLKEPYVVVLPTVNGYWANTQDYRAFAGMYFDYWLEIAKFIRECGYRVVCYGTEQGCDESMAKKIGDEVIWVAEKYICHKNQSFADQIRIMKGAKVSIGIGGVAHIFLAFNLPAVGIDCSFYTTYKHFYGMIAQKRSNLWLLPELHQIIRDYGLMTATTLKEANGIVRDSFMQKLAGVL